MNVRSFSCAAIIAVSCAAGTARAQDAFADAFWEYRAYGGFDYSSGHYGSTEVTEVYYASATLRASKGPWAFKATVPWLRVVGPAALLDGAGSGALTTSTISRHESGVGDIGLYATYSIQSLYQHGLFVDLTARVKAPTASFSKGLGTGKADVGAQIDVAKSLGKFMPLITAGYRVTGSPAGYDLRDIVYGTVGMQYNWSPRVVTGALFDYRQSSLRNAENPKEVTGYVNVKIAEAWTVNVYGVVGFSRNSPDRGGGLVISYRWP